MQLASVSIDPIIDLSKKLGSAKTLLNSINSNAGDAIAHSFHSILRASKESFPSVALKLDGLTKKSLDKMTQAQKMELKTALKDDVAALLEKAEETTGGSKFFAGEQVPADPDECLMKLEEIKARKESEIEQLNKELEDMEEARFVVETIKEIKRKAAGFDDALFTLMPTPPNGSSVKKPRV